MPRREPKSNPPRRKKPHGRGQLRVVTPQPLLPDPDFSESRTEVETLVPAKVGGAPPARSGDGTKERSNAKLLLVASVVSLVVIVLSLYVLGGTLGGFGEEVKQEASVAPPPATIVKEVIKETEAPKADVMLNLDVEPKDADVSVQPTRDGFRVRVSKPGYKPQERTIERGVVERIAIELEKAPKKKRPKRTRRPRRAKKKGKGRSPGDVFLTGGDL